jgi:prepilin-type N-terminal cleavage/methylation domain-containing protein
MNKKQKITSAVLRSGRSAQGFTLIELVIVLVVSGILIITVTPFFKVNIDSYMRARGGKEMLQSTRIGFNRMISELRRMQYTNLQSISSSQIKFQGRSADGFQFAQPVIYKYSSSDGQVQRTDVSGNNVRLIEGVSVFSVTGYKSDGSTTTSTGSVWRIKIKITLGMDENTSDFYMEIFPKGLQMNQW